MTLAGAAIGILWWVLAAANAIGRHLCFERGLVRRSLFGQREVAYKDVGAFCYGEVAVHMYGIHTRTTVIVRFEPVGYGCCDSATCTSKFESITRPE